MKTNKKLLTIAVASVMALSLAIGGGTFAIFTSAASNTGNSFTAGTLHIDSKRDDVPNDGPMFYTETSPDAQGTMPTGVWAPGDKHTRGLFLKNTGSLQAGLHLLAASTADADGMSVSSGQYYNDDMKFANNARLKIWKVNWFDPVGNLIPWLKLDATQMDMIMDYVNEGYAQWAAANPGADPLQGPDLLNVIIEYVNIYMLQHINEIRGNNPAYKDGFIKVTKLVNKNMGELVNRRIDVSDFNITTEPGQAQLLAFTVELKKVAGNELQGVSSFFNFHTYWEQTKHNPVQK